MSDADDFSRSIPFGVRRGAKSDPADRTPKRGATSGLGPDGKRVVHVPGEGTHDLESSPPAPIPTQDPNIPEPKE